MKLTMLVLLFVLAVGTAFAQDTTATPAGNFYADSLKSSAYPATTGNGSPRDTVDVVVSSMSGIDFFQIRASSSSADTLTVSVQSPGSTDFVQRALVSLTNATLTSARATYAITGTTTIDWVVLGGPEVKKFRFTSPGTTNAVYFTVSGQRGIPKY